MKTLFLPRPSDQGTHSIAFISSWTASQRATHKPWTRLTCISKEATRKRRTGTPSRCSCAVKSTPLRQTALREMLQEQFECAQNHPRCLEARGISAWRLLGRKRGRLWMGCTGFRWTTRRSVACQYSARRRLLMTAGHRSQVAAGYSTLRCKGAGGSREAAAQTATPELCLKSSAQCSCTQRRRRKQTSCCCTAPPIAR